MEQLELNGRPSAPEGMMWQQRYPSLYADQSEQKAGPVWRLVPKPVEPPPLTEGNLLEIVAALRLRVEYLEEEVSNLGGNVLDETDAIAEAIVLLKAGKDPEQAPNEQVGAMMDYIRLTENEDANTDWENHQASLAEYDDDVADPDADTDAEDDDDDPDYDPELDWYDDRPV